MAEEMRIAQPMTYYKKFLEQNVRPDGRGLGECREAVLNVGGDGGGCISTAEGSALLRMGNTLVVCGIKAELAAPRLESPEDGYIVPNVELSPLCSPNVRPGPPVLEAQVLSCNLADVIKSSGCVDAKDLCIVPGKVVWALHIDVVCLDHDGNLTDASVTAMIAALHSTCLPKISVDDMGESKADFTNTRKLDLMCYPVSLSTSILDELLIVDPTHQEEELSSGCVTVVTNGDDVCSVVKLGGSTLTDSQMERCVERAFQRHAEVRKLITVATHSHRHNTGSGA